MTHRYTTSYTGQDDEYHCVELLKWLQRPGLGVTEELWLETAYELFDAEGLYQC